MRSPFFDTLAAEVERLGGYHNAHVHLDRANTLDDGFVDHGRVKVLESSHISLQKKHKLIASVHEGPAYDRDNLERRVRDTLDIMVDVGTRLVDTMVDVTADRVGTSALETMMAIANDYDNALTLRSAAYTPLGFRDDEPDRWNVFEAGAKIADFIGCLPEADDVDDYPDNIGFEEHCTRMHDLARRTGKMLHVHTDQLNIPQENGTERLMEIVLREGVLGGDEPQIWAVHAISPSTYDDARWDAYVEALLEANVGIISCPSAAVGMRQLRTVLTPTNNSIVRVLELAAAGVPLRLASDNIADMCSPTTTADLTDEVYMLSAAVRYYKPSILAKFATGTALTVDEREELRDHLDKNNAEIDKLVGRWT